MVKKVKKTRKGTGLELYNIDKAPFKKKDKDAYYYDDQKFTPVPKLSDDKGEIISFLRVCMNQPTEVIEELWDEAFEKNKIILEALEQLRIESSADETNRWQSIAYAKAIKELKTLEVPIVSGEQAKKIKGVGKGIAAAIDEVLRSGELKPKEERERSKAEFGDAIKLFMEVWGVNKKVAGEWYKKGYRTLEDIPDDELTEEQKVGIKYASELNLPTEREYIEEIEKWIDANLAKIVGRLATKIYLVGDYRRGAETKPGYNGGTDIEILISAAFPAKETLSTILKRFPFVKYTSNIHKAKSSKDSNVFIAESIIELSDKSHRKLKTTLVPSNSIGARLLLSTGPDAFVLQLKEQAAQMGYRLSEDGFYKISGAEDEKLSFNEEKIFTTLGMDYVPPEDRF